MKIYFKSHLIFISLATLTKRIMLSFLLLFKLNQNSKHLSKYVFNAQLFPAYFLLLLCKCTTFFFYFSTYFFIYLFMLNYYLFVVDVYEIYDFIHNSLSLSITADEVCYACYFYLYYYLLLLLLFQ